MFRCPTLPAKAGDFFAAVIFLLGMPLAPILAEKVYGGQVNTGTLTLTASLYAIAVGVSSNNRGYFYVTVAACLFYGLLYGRSSEAFAKMLEAGHKAQDDFGLRMWSWIGISLIGLSHVGERWNRHIVDGKPFFEFPNAS